MTTYDFKTLSDQDFEELVCDLLERHLDVKLQIFARGRDGGVDLRNSFRGREHSIVIQCKHYAESTTAQLIASARKERLKLDALDIAKLRYYFVTSHSLSVEATDRLFKIFSPYCENAHCIIGREMLNRILSANSDIEIRHFKLWLTSAGILKQVINARLHTLTLMTIDDVRNAYQRFVRVPALSDAYRKLEEQGHVILTGIPGAGKTTLAHVLVAKYLDRGYRATSLSGSLHELLDVLSHSDERPQIILFDDFLGESALQITFDGQSAALFERILALLTRRPRLRLVFTTREYILAKARDLSERFDRLNEGALLAKSVVSVDNLGRERKARILYNHLYYSDIPKSHLRKLVGERIYEYVIRHDNFNPRLVEEICKQSIVSKLSASEYVEYVRNSFDNPGRLWDHAFQRQLDENCREICFLLVSLGPLTTLDALKKCFSEAAKAENRPVSDGQFSRALRALEGNFLRTGMLRGLEEIAAEFHSPSIKDYVANALASAPLSLASLVENAVHFSQLVTLSEYRDTSHQYLYRPLIGGSKKRVLEKAYSLAMKGLKRPFPIPVSIGFSRSYYSSKASLLERACQLIDLHMALDVDVDHVHLDVLSEMVACADAATHDMLAADCARLARSIREAEQVGILDDAEMKSLAIGRLAQILEEGPSLNSMDSTLVVYSIFSETERPNLSVSARQGVARLLAGVKAAHLSDKVEARRAVNMALQCHEMLGVDTEHAVSNLRKIESAIEIEDDAIYEYAERRTLAPVIENRFDIDSAFRSFLDERDQ